MTLVVDFSCPSYTQPTLIWCFGLVVWCSAKVAFSRLFSVFFHIKNQAGNFFSQGKTKIFNILEARIFYGKFL